MRLRISSSLGLLAALLWASPGQAQCLGFQCPPRVLGAAASGTSPPLDGFTTPTGAYSFRKLLTAYAGSAVQLQRVDTTTQDIGFVGGDFDLAAAAAFCTTTCKVKIWYDQSGNSRNLVQATAANQPPYIASCTNGRPCFQTTSAALVLSSAGSITPATGLVSISAVADRVSGTGAAVWLREDGAGSNRMTANTSANTWLIGPGGSLSAAAADNAWHSAFAVLSPVVGQSLINIDGVEAAGTTIPVTASGVTSVAGAATTTARQAEAIFWDNLTLAGRAALLANQRSWYGTP